MELEHTDLLPAPEQWGHIRLLEKIGEGSFGDVYRGWETRLECEVAVKILKAANPQCEAWIEEARKLAKLQHPGVLRVFGADQFDGRPGIWTEFVRGETLSQAMDRRGVCSEREAAGIVLDVGRALAAVHSAGIVHRDIKCQNIMRDTLGRIVVMDLGAASRFEMDDGDGIVGTPYYMAPEIFRGDRATPRSDIYSLGVVLFRLVTGRYPVAAQSAHELVRLHGEGSRQHVRDLRPDLSLEFTAVVERMLARDPSERFQTVGELEQALQGALDTNPAVVPRPSVVRPKLRLFALIGATVLVGALALSWSVSSRSGRSHIAVPDSGGPVSGRVETSFFRRSDGEFERLTSGSSVEVGDQIFAEFTCDDSLWTYVLNEDDTGQIRLVFPISGSETQNPLPPAESHHLPGTSNGRPIYWKISSESATEGFLIIATRERSRRLEHELYSLATPHGQIDGSLALGIPDKERMRGVGEVVVGNETMIGGSLIESLREMAKSDTPGAEVWAHHVSFRHKVD